MQSLNLIHPADDGRPIEIVSGGLYSPFPIRPYQILAAAKEHVAKDVLMCFTSHLGYGKSSNCVWLSLTKICEETGRSRSAVVRGYRVLVEFGFIKVAKWKSSNGWANRYYFQPSCYHGQLLNEKAIEFTKVFGQCEACNKIVRDPEASRFRMCQNLKDQGRRELLGIEDKCTSTPLLKE